MYEIAIAEAGAADETWACSLAGRALDDAIRSMDAVRASIFALTADTEWEADGVRALHRKLLGVLRDGEAEERRLRDRAWEIDRFVAS